MTSATGQVENRQAPRRCSPDSVEMSVVTSTILIVIIIVIVTITIVIITVILP